MKLLGGGNSPYARKVRIVADEKRITYDNVAASPSDPASGVQDANPLGKIPVLICDDGSAVYDSPVIVDYLDGLGAGFGRQQFDLQAQCLDLGVGGAAGEVVVDHAHGLHEGVDGGRPDERPAPVLEVPA